MSLYKNDDEFIKKLYRNIKNRNTWDNLKGKPNIPPLYQIIYYYFPQCMNPVSTDRSIMIDIIDDTGTYRKAVIKIHLQLSGNGTLWNANISSISPCMTKSSIDRLKIYVEGSYSTPCNIYASIREESNGHTYSISGIHVPDMIVHPCTNGTLLTSLPSGAVVAIEVTSNF